jgi:replicative DNA helicase
MAAGKIKKNYKKEEDLHFDEDFEGQTPPNASELEKKIICGILIDNSILHELLEILNYKHFYHERNSIIFRAIVNMYDRNEAIDATTLISELNKLGKINEIGGNEYIVDIMNSSNIAANLLQYAKIVIEKYILRRLITVSGNIITNCFDATVNPFNILDESERKILEVSEMLSKKKVISVNDEIKKIFEQLADRRSTKDITGIRTGFSDLDRLTNGFQRSELIIIAGRPSHGKTALALNIARNAAVNYKHNVAIFSLEMTARELMIRLLASEAMVEGQKIKTGYTTKEEWSKIASTYERLKTNIYIDDSSELSILELRAKARRMKLDYGIDLVIVDYLQLIRGNESFERRDLEVGYVSRSLKALAKELDIPVVACAQLNRSVEKGGKERKPILSDLRESGSIEQDADVVIFVHRPALSDKFSNADEDLKKEKQRQAEIIVGKQRNGPTGDLELVFFKEFTKFGNKSIDLNKSLSEIVHSQVSNEEDSSF